MAELRNLKIKTGVVARMVKEVASYQKELLHEEKRTEDMIQAGRDEHDIRKQKEVLQETRSMIPDSERRLKASLAELQDLVSQGAHLAGSEEYEAATQMLKDAAPK